jgi:hypothetical protein
MLKARDEPTSEPLPPTYEEHCGPIKEAVISAPPILVVSRRRMIDGDSD